MGSLREVRTLSRRILAFLNADPRQQLPRGTVAPLRGRDRMPLRLVPVFFTIRRVAMIAGLPYTVLCDTILTHPTFVEGLIPLLSSVAESHGVAEATTKSAA